MQVIEEKLISICSKKLQCVLHVSMHVKENVEFKTYTCVVAFTSVIVEIIIHVTVLCFSAPFRCPTCNYSLPPYSADIWTRTQRT